MSSANSSTGIDSSLNRVPSANLQGRGIVGALRVRNGVVPATNHTHIPFDATHQNRVSNLLQRYSTEDRDRIITSRSLMQNAAVLLDPDNSIWVTLQPQIEAGGQPRRDGNGRPMFANIPMFAGATRRENAIETTIDTRPNQTSLFNDNRESFRAIWHANANRQVLAADLMANGFQPMTPPPTGATPHPNGRGFYVRQISVEEEVLNCIWIEGLTPEEMVQWWSDNSSGLLQHNDTLAFPPNLPFQFAADGASVLPGLTLGQQPIELFDPIVSPFRNYYSPELLRLLSFVPVAGEQYLYQYDPGTDTQTGIPHEIRIWDTRLNMYENQAAIGLMQQEAPAGRRYAPAQVTATNIHAWVEEGRSSRHQDSQLVAHQGNTVYNAPLLATHLQFTAANQMPARSIPDEYRVDNIYVQNEVVEDQNQQANITTGYYYVWIAGYSLADMQAWESTAPHDPLRISALQTAEYLEHGITGLQRRQMTLTDNDFRRGGPGADGSEFITPSTAHPTGVLDSSYARRFEAEMSSLQAVLRDIQGDEVDVPLNDDDLGSYVGSFDFSPTVHEDLLNTEEQRQKIRESLTDQSPYGLRAFAAPTTDYVFDVPGAPSAPDVGISAFTDTLQPSTSTIVRPQPVHPEPTRSLFGETPDTTPGRLFSGSSTDPMAPPLPSAPTAPSFSRPLDTDESTGTSSTLGSLTRGAGLSTTAPVFHDSSQAPEAQDDDDDFLGALGTKTAGIAGDLDISQPSIFVPQARYGEVQRQTLFGKAPYQQRETGLGNTVTEDIAGSSGFADRILDASKQEVTVPRKAIPSRKDRQKKQ